MFGASIPPRAVHEIFECLAALMLADVVCNIGADRLGIAVCRAVRRHRDFGVASQWAVFRKRLGHEDIECRGMEFT